MVTNDLANDEHVVEDLAQRRRSWLSSLPHEQIVEIVFKLEKHASDEVKKSVWPEDLVAEKANGDSATLADGDNGADVVSAGAPQDIQNASDQSTVDTVERPSSVHPPSQSQSPAAQNTSVSTPPPLPPPHPQVTQPQLYPHTPYYAPYPGLPFEPRPDQQQAQVFAQFPYPGYAAYTTLHQTSPPLQQPPYPYPHYPLPPPPPPPQPSSHTDHAQQPLFTSAPLTRNPLAAPKSSTPKGSGAKPGDEGDDLPSYEEMIVEALLEAGDEDGTAPKVLFGRMASRYPLQANFRPSASQALQKAFKRGRLEKSNEGKYRLNAAWEGGNTSRRTTRRPQAFAHTPGIPSPLSASMTASPPASHPQPPFQHPAPQPHAHYPHPWAQYPFSTPPPQPQDHAPAPSTSTQNQSHNQNSNHDHAPGSAGDAWEAAQNILQALNIGSLLSQPATSSADTQSDPHPKSQNEVHGGNADASASSGPPIIAGNFGFNFGISATSDSNALSSQLTPSAQSMVSNSPASTYMSTNATGGAAIGNGRAALQASLATLAAQLADIAGAGAGAGVEGSAIGFGGGATVVKS